MNGIISRTKLLSLGFVVTCALQVLAQESSNITPETSKVPRPAISSSSEEGRHVLGQTSTVEDKERERGIQEGRVKAYDAGLQIDLRGVAIPELNIEALRKGDKTALIPLLELLSKYDMPVFDLEFRFVTAEERAVDNFRFRKIIEIDQIILGQNIGFFLLEIRGDNEGAGKETVHNLGGLLINPNLPQLNPDNWIPEQDAIQMATDVLMRDVKSDGNSNWFLKQVEEGTLVGKMEIELGSSEEELTVNPVYVISGDETEVRINRYDGKMKTYSQAPFHLTTQTNTNVCKSGMTSNGNRCENVVCLR